VLTHARRRGVRRPRGSALIVGKTLDAQLWSELRVEEWALLVRLNRVSRMRLKT